MLGGASPSLVTGLQEHQVVYALTRVPMKVGAAKPKAHTG